MPRAVTGTVRAARRAVAAVAALRATLVYGEAAKLCPLPSAVAGSDDLHGRGEAAAERILHHPGVLVATGHEHIQRPAGNHARDQRVGEGGAERARGLVVA
jgi:hypothetical protein